MELNRVKHQDLVAYIKKLEKLLEDPTEKENHDRYACWKAEAVTELQMRTNRREWYLKKFKIDTDKL